MLYLHGFGVQCYVCMPYLWGVGRNAAICTCIITLYEICISKTFICYHKNENIREINIHKPARNLYLIVPNKTMQRIALPEILSVKHLPHQQIQTFYMCISKMHVLYI